MLRYGASSRSICAALIFAIRLRSPTLRDAAPTRLATTPSSKSSPNVSSLPENQKKLALTVLMRKLILLANRLL
ncbi:MAG: hypothetical protein WCQ57_13845, partial [Verrucomicrobiota bacterium]